MTSTEEVLVKLGLDSREFSQRLREAQKNAKDAEKAFNQGQQRRDGLDPVTANRASVAQLSQNSRDLLNQRKGLLGMFDEFKQSVTAVNPALGGLIGKLPTLATRLGLIGIAAMAVKAPFDAMRSAFYEVKEASDLGVTVNFMRRLSITATMVGEDADEAKGRLLRFQQVLALAADGNKEALEKLGRVGIKDPTGKTLEENAMAVADAFAKITDRTKEAKSSVDLFGKGSQTIMPDVLKGMRGSKPTGYDKEFDHNAATLAEGWKVSKSIWETTQMKPLRGLANLGKFYLAKGLEGVGIKGTPEKASVIEQSESVAAEARAKTAEELAAARKQVAAEEYKLLATDAKIEGSTGRITKLVSEQGKLAKDGINTDEKRLEYEKKSLELLKERGTLKDLEKTKGDAIEARHQKEISYEKQKLALEKQRRDLAKADEDRRKWTVGDMANSGYKRGNDGRAIIPDEQLRSVERATGRKLAQWEIEKMRDNLTGNLSKAGTVMNLQNAAHLGELFGFSDATNSAFMNKADKQRKAIGALTSGEKDPAGALAESMAALDEGMASLVSLASKDGIVIRPRMGK